MMLYKCIPARDLESATTEGWALVSVLSSTKPLTVSAQTPVALDGSCAQLNTYNSAPSVQSYLREEIVAVSEPMFLLSKDSDMASREQGLKNELQKMRESIEPLNLRHTNDERDIKEMTKKLEEALADKKHFRDSLDKEQTVRRTAEGQLAAIRTAIGTVRFDEIINP